MNKESNEKPDQPQSRFTTDNEPPVKVTLDPISPSGEKPKVKRKRKSPAVPWKKPKDMPKRPLSAYNLFFKDERERLLGTAASQKKEGDQATTGAKTGKRKKSTGGIGFANLAKTIAAKWNDLDPESRAPYEQTAAKEKARYDAAVAKWRAEQKEKAAKEKAMKAEAEEQSAKGDSVVFDANPSDKIHEGFPLGDASTYPAQWFHSGMEHHQHSEMDPGIPPFVNAMNDESSRSYASALSHDSPRRRGRPSPGSHSVASSLSPNTPPGEPSPSYYSHSAPYHGHHDPYSRARAYSRRRVDPYATAASLHMGNTMRDPRQGRSSSMPHSRAHLPTAMDRIQMEVAELRRARTSFFQEGDMASYPSQSHYTHHTSRSAPPPGTPHPSQGMAHPRSASLPANMAMQPPHPAEAEDVSFSGDRESRRGGRRSRRSPTEPNEEAVFEASLRSLSENLDDDAISFLTTMRFE